MKLAEIIEDTGINKGVIVSKRGFTEDGISFVKYKNIGLVELREIEQKDRREFNLGMLKINTELRRPEVVTILIDNIGPNLKAEEVIPSQLRIRTKDGQVIPFEKYLMAFKKTLHKQEPYKLVQKTYQLKNAELVNDISKKVIRIRSIQLKGQLTVINDFIKWHIVDEVWLIMKSLFEDKSFTVSKNGVIQQRKPKNQ